jgi:hypothetical protein
MCIDVRCDVRLEHLLRRPEKFPRGEAVFGHDQEQRQTPCTSWPRMPWRYTFMVLDQSACVLADFRKSMHITAGPQRAIR